MLTKRKRCALIIQHEFNVTYLKAVADLKVEINNFNAVADMKMK